MDTATIAIIISVLTLVINLAMHMIGGGWSVSKQLASFETSIANIQEEIKKLGEVLVKMADMRGDIRTLNTRLTTAELDIRELRHGDGFIRGKLGQGTDKEYP